MYLSAYHSLSGNYYDNKDFSLLSGVSIDEINNKKIFGRIIFDSKKSQSLLMANCITEMLQKEKISLSDIDCLLVASAIPEQALPNTASAILKHLGSSIYGVDINMSCLSFLSAAQIANLYLSCGIYNNIIVISCDLPHRCLNYKNIESSVIFGEGCVSYLFSNNTKYMKKEIKILDFMFKTLNDSRESCQIKIGGTLHNLVSGYDNNDFYFNMDGKKLFKDVSYHIEDFVNEFLSKNNMKIEDIDYLIPHQASFLGLNHIINRLKIDEKKVINIFNKYGNQVSASIPNTLSTFFDTSLSLSDKNLLLIGTGAGTTLGASLWKI